MLQQGTMIERVRRICRLDERLTAAMMYGSFAQSEGDEFSDVEFILFFDEAYGDIDQKEWVSQIAPVELHFVNEFGVGTAIFDNLVRGEFHFGKASDIEKVDEAGRGDAPERLSLGLGLGQRDDAVASREARCNSAPGALWTA